MLHSEILWTGRTTLPIMQEKWCCIRTTNYNLEYFVTKYEIQGKTCFRCFGF